MTTIKLTPKQKQIYDFICQETNEGGIIPGLTEIYRALGIAHGSVQWHLSVLERNGLLAEEKSSYCNIRIYRLAVAQASTETKASQHGGRPPDLFALYRAWEV